MYYHSVLFSMPILKINPFRAIIKDGCNLPGSAATLEDKYLKYMKTTTKQAGLVFTNRILGYAFRFLLQTVLARFLGPDKYGLYLLELTVANV